MAAPPSHEAIATVWKTEAARVVAALARIVRNLDVAEELAQDALLAALEDWPRSGLPDRPGAWLMTTAKNRALNALRNARRAERKHEALAHELEAQTSPGEIEAALDALGVYGAEEPRDDVLRLIFTACHPVLGAEARVALTLKLVAGLTTAEIARAFLTLEPTIAQRIVRAKRTLGEARVPFEVPVGESLAPRLSSVLEVVYLVFNEGYTASAGDELMRPALVGEAIRLGQLLAELAPDLAEVRSLLALMKLHASRAPARVDAAGDPVLLLDQDRTRWDAGLLAGGLADLAAAATRDEAPGPYRLQAEIAACHARARRAEDTDWVRIADLYGQLERLVPTPVVRLNRAVAVSRASGPAAGLAALDALAGEPALARYHLLPSARAELLEKLGRLDEARQVFEQAADLAENARQRTRLRERARACIRSK